MSENTLNISNLMQAAPSKSATEQAGLLGSIDQSEELLASSQEQSFDMIFGNMLASLSPEQIAQNVSLVQPDQELGLLNTEQYLVGQDEQLADDNILAFNKELDDLNLKNSSLQNLNLKEILANQNQELESGNFKVLSKEVVDSQLTLTIENSEGKQLTISLPVDSIQKDNNLGAMDRVQLQSSTTTKEIESLIEKVNIKHIEVKTIDAKVSTSELKPVEISLVGEQNSSVVTLKASLKKNQIKLNKLQATTSHPKAAVLDESGLFDKNVRVKNVQPNQLIEKVVVGTNQQNANGTMILNQQVGAKETTLNQAMNIVNPSGSLYGTESLDSIEAKENISNVRMQLPDNIKSVLRPNGQAVVIKMNPENLGPAKLSLTFSGGKLRAKLIVSSVNAKQVLDGSMTRLVDQLQKIDINVEKIDVTLDQNQDQNEQYKQQQQWQRKMSHKNIDLSQFEQTELAETVQQPMIAAAQPVVSGSVNYLA